MGHRQDAALAAVSEDNLNDGLVKCFYPRKQAWKWKQEETVGLVADGRGEY